MPENHNSRGLGNYNITKAQLFFNGHRPRSRTDEYTPSFFGQVLDIVFRTVHQYSEGTLRMKRSPGYPPGLCVLETSHVAC
jgi:hypothetical protein